MRRNLRVQRSVPMIMAIAVLASACGDDGTTDLAATPEHPTPVEDATPVEDTVPFGLQRCPTETERPSAPEHLYRDEPVYAGDGQPTKELRAWAMDKPGFEETWIDREHRGWVSLAFSEDADARQAELEAEFPGVGAVIVPVELTTAEASALRDEVATAMEAGGVGSSYGMGGGVSAGGVQVSVPVLDEKYLAPLAVFADRALCVSGLDPSEAVAAGPQPTEGDGWRLLGSDRTGHHYRTGVATTDEQYAELWGLAGLTTDRPEVDFDTEIVIWFGAVYGSGCEIRLDDVVVDIDHRLVHGLFVLPGNEVACNQDANPEAYVVAVDRAGLPPAPFAVQLGEEDPPSGAPEERTLVSVDLRDPGSVADDADLGPDPALLSDAAGGWYVVAAGGIVEPGYEVIYDLDLSCDFTTIGPFNGIVWAADDETLDPGDPPLAWVSGSSSNGIVATDLLLTEDPPRLTLAVSGQAETYSPAPAGTTSDCP